MNCNEAVEALVASVETGEAITDEQREHIRSCVRCREVLDSVKNFQSTLEQEPSREPSLDSAAVENAVRSEHVKSIASKIVIFFIALASFTLFLGYVFARVGFGLPELFITLVVLLLGFGPIVVLYYVARSIARRQGKQLYRRLDPRRWWLGVCVGVSEATGIDVGWFRLGFVLITIMGSGVGVLFYIVMALAMPVHPADREYLWRFQAKRLFARFRSQ